MPSTWMPRAATSVATSTWTRPSLKSAIARVRAPWVMPPCSGTAAYAAGGELLGDAVGAELGADEHDGAALAVRRSRLNMCVLVLAVTMNRWCSMVSTGQVAGSSSWRTGSCMWWRTSSSTSPSRVAENSSLCAVLGHRSSSARTSGRKPMSAIWSASSSTATSRSSRMHAPWLDQVGSRPGRGDEHVDAALAGRRSACPWRARRRRSCSAARSRRPSGLEGVADLHRELARRYEDEPVRLARRGGTRRRRGSSAAGRTPASCRSRCWPRPGCRVRRARRGWRPSGSRTARAAPCAPALRRAPGPARRSANVGASVTAGGAGTYALTAGVGEPSVGGTTVRLGGSWAWSSARAVTDVPRRSGGATRRCARCASRELGAIPGCGPYPTALSPVRATRRNVNRMNADRVTRRTTEC